MNVLVSTDTSCIVNYDILKKYNVSVFPLNVIIDGEEFLDGVTINQDQLKDAMRSEKDVKTSTPPLGEIYEYFEKLFAKGYDHIIHFTISSKLSSMYELFCNVAKQHFDGKLTIIDSYSISTIMLSHVLYTYEEVNKGTSLEEIVENVSKRIQNNPIVFVPENLTALKNGGRLSPAAAAIGTILGIKPVIVLEDGALEKSEVVRNVKRAFSERIAKLIKDYPISDYDWSVIGFDPNESTINYVKDQVQQVAKDYNVITGVLPINVCAHCGPGTIGIIVSPKINGKSVNEFM